MTCWTLETLEPVVKTLIFLKWQSYLQLSVLTCHCFGLVTGRMCVCCCAAFHVSQPEHQQCQQQTQSCIVIELHLQTMNN